MPITKKIRKKNLKKKIRKKKLKKQIGGLNSYKKNVVILKIIMAI